MALKAYKTLAVKPAHAATNGVATVLLNRPKKKNAITYDMYTELGTALLELGTQDATKAIVLSASGDYYSSGNDLANFSKLMHPLKMAKQAKVTCATFVNSFLECEKPIVVAANGPAIGIAVTTMGLCDRRLSVPSATFHTPFKALGQAPEGCSSFMFPRLMGADMARRVLDDGYKFDAAEGLQMGFLDTVSTDRDALERDALAAATELGASGEGRWFDKEPGLYHELRRVNQREVDVLERAWVSAECFEALSAYLASRRQHGPALVLRGLNLTRPLWDRDDLHVYNK